MKKVLHINTFYDNLLSKLLKRKPMRWIYLQYYLIKYSSFFNLIEITIDRYTGKKCLFLPIFNFRGIFPFNNAKM